MLDLTTISTLLDDLADVPVLSVYIAADDHDPALRQAWRLRLASQLGLTRSAVPQEELDRFDSARSLLEAQLRPVKGFLPGPAWVAFATEDAVLVSGPLLAPVEDRVRWRRGPLLGPALRALKQERPVLLALVDSRRGRIFRYAAGDAVEIEDLRADVFIDDMTDRNSSKRASTRSGSRGETATDAAERILDRESGQLHAALAMRLQVLSGDEAHVLVAGPAEARNAVRSLLRGLPALRVADDVSLPVSATTAEVRSAIELHASELTTRRQQLLLGQVLSDARAGGRGAVGLSAIRHALEQGQVDRLFVSVAYATEKEDVVEPILARCLAQGGAIEAVSGSAMDLLEGAGMAARLRFVVAPALT
jgi:hypothetical protein